jgi:hypothetical protein
MSGLRMSICARRARGSSGALSDQLVFDQASKAQKNWQTES